MFVIPMWTLTGIFSRSLRRETKQRLCCYPSVWSCENNKKKYIWIHASSVGEIQAARVLIAELTKKRTDLLFTVTTMTRQGYKVARKQLPAEVKCRYAPLDIPFLVRRALKKINPDMYICLETELWPAMLTEARKAGIKMLLLNGRMSKRSCKRYALAIKFMRNLLGGFSALGVITPEDKKRYSTLGVTDTAIQVTGNMKYALQLENRSEITRTYRSLLSLGDETVFICGSTRSGEERLLANVYKRLHHATNGRIVWIIAPRHLQRLPEVKKLLCELNIQYDLYTELQKNKRRHAVILVDCMGELAKIYAVGDFIFCGGSLVDKGGHNIMEAAKWGKPVYYGPSMRDFRDAAELMEKNGAGFRAGSNTELADILLNHLHNKTEYEQGCRAAVKMASNQHEAARRQADMVLQCLQPETGNTH